MENALRIEFHCHTAASPDSLVKPSDLVAVCQSRGIDRVVITDHNSISGALKAKELDPERVIIGEEIRTTKGELLAAFVKEEIPKGLSPKETINILRGQGAFISVSHPFDRFRKPWEISDLIDVAPLIDAVEIFNSRCLNSSFNDSAKDFANKYGLSGTAGSDAHTLAELGRGAMILPKFENAESLRESLKKVRYERQRSGLTARLASRYAALYKGIKSGA